MELTIFAKSSILDAWQGSKYISVLSAKVHQLISVIIRRQKPEAYFSTMLNIYDENLFKK